MTISHTSQSSAAPKIGRACLANTSPQARRSSRGEVSGSASAIRRSTAVALVLSPARRGEVAHGLRHLAAQIQHRHGGDVSECKHDAPLHIGRNPDRAEQQQGPGCSGGAGRPHHPEAEGDFLSAVAAIGVLCHDRRRQHVVGADAKAEDEADADKTPQIGGKGPGERRDRHQHNVHAIEFLAPVLRQRAEYQRTDTRADQGRAPSMPHSRPVVLATPNEVRTSGSTRPIDDRS